MDLTRRSALLLGSGAVAAASMSSLPACASPAEAAIEALTGGGALDDGVITLSAPEIAENGNSVSISVAAPGAAMVAVFADGNPEPRVATIRFGPLNPTRRASTRIRLARTQNVIAVAKMEDGSFRKTQAAVKVTIGGCGG